MRRKLCGRHGLIKLNPFDAEAVRAQVCGQVSGPDLSRQVQYRPGFRLELLFHQVLQRNHIAFGLANVCKAQFTGKFCRCRSDREYGNSLQFLRDADTGQGCQGVCAGHRNRLPGVVRNGGIIISLDRQ